MCYLFTISGATVLIALGNFIVDGKLHPLAFLKILAISVLGVASVIAVDGVCAFVVRRFLPEKWFSPEARAFTVPKWENDLYHKSNVGAWKKYVPEWGCFTGFHKDRVRDPKSSEYIGRFLIESNYGVLGHVVGAFFGFLIMLLPFLRPFSIALPIAVVNFVLSLLPTFVLRSNTTALRKLYRRAKARDEAQKIVKV